MQSRVATVSFRELVDPLLADPNRADVLRALRRDWPPERLISLLVSPDQRVVQAAATSLGMTGAMEHCRYLVSLLQKDDDDLVAVAERSLWQIWMRSGSRWGVDALSGAVAQIEAERYRRALDLLAPIRQVEPDFAEPHHQWGLVCNLLERYDESEQAYQQALRLNAYHFAASQGLGRVNLEQGRLLSARDHYRFALSIHPRLAGVRDIVDVIDALLGGGGAAKA